MQRFVEVTLQVRLWVEDMGRGDASALMLIMGRAASGLYWPDALVESLAEHHRVIRYDHRDTGRSTWAFDQHPYAIADLADDVLVILDDLGVDRAHVVGMSMGGMLVQMLLLDHPDRLLSATVFATSALGTVPGASGPGSDPELPGPDRRPLALWERMEQEGPRDREAEIERRVEEWHLLNGDAIDFDADGFRRLEERLIDHAGRHDTTTAHDRADRRGLDRGAELASVSVPTLVIDAPEDTLFPPPHATHVARSIGNARLVTIPGMGHALSPPILAPLAAAILDHTTAVDRTG